jgi:hypothetical protein
MGFLYIQELGLSLGEPAPKGCGAEIRDEPCAFAWQLQTGQKGTAIAINPRY